MTIINNVSHSPNFPLSQMLEYLSHVSAVKLCNAYTRFAFTYVYKIYCYSNEWCRLKGTNTIIVLLLLLLPELLLALQMLHHHSYHHHFTSSPSQNFSMDGFKIYPTPPPSPRQPPKIHLKQRRKQNVIIFALFLLFFHFVFVEIFCRF